MHRTSSKQAFFTSSSSSSSSFPIQEELKWSWQEDYWLSQAAMDRRRRRYEARQQDQPSHRQEAELPLLRKNLLMISTAKSSSSSSSINKKKRSSDRSKSSVTMEINPFAYDDDEESEPERVQEDRYHQITILYGDKSLGEQRRKLVRKVKRKRKISVVHNTTTTSDTPNNDRKIVDANMISDTSSDQLQQQHHHDGEVEKKTDKAAMEVEITKQTIEVEQEQEQEQEIEEEVEETIYVGVQGGFLSRLKPPVDPTPVNAQISATGNKIDTEPDTLHQQPEINNQISTENRALETINPGMTVVETDPKLIREKILQKIAQRKQAFSTHTSTATTKRLRGLIGGGTTNTQEHLLSFALQHTRLMKRVVNNHDNHRKRKYASETDPELNDESITLEQFPLHVTLRDGGLRSQLAWNEYAAEMMPFLRDRDHSKICGYCLQLIGADSSETEEFVSINDGRRLKCHRSCAELVKRAIYIQDDVLHRSPYLQPNNISTVIKSSVIVNILGPHRKESNSSKAMKHENDNSSDTSDSESDVSCWLCGHDLGLLLDIAISCGNTLNKTYKEVETIHVPCLQWLLMSRLLETVSSEEKSESQQLQTIETKLTKVEEDKSTSFVTEEGKVSMIVEEETVLEERNLESKAVDENNDRIETENRMDVVQNEEIHNNEVSPTIDEEPVKHDRKPIRLIDVLKNTEDANRFLCSLCRRNSGIISRCLAMHCQIRAHLFCASYMHQWNVITIKASSDDIDASPSSFHCGGIGFLCALHKTS
jgi:hypothetical protein